MDVHASTVTAAALNVATGEITEASLAADNTTVATWVAGFGDDGQVTYEAGPSGYGMARHLLANNVDCVIAAPSNLLRALGDHVKTDRRDPLGLTRMLSLGDITEVRIPSIDQEGLRDIPRARQRAVTDLSHARQRINSILLRHGVVYGDKAKRIGVHHEWLARQRLESSTSQLALAAELETEVL